MGKTQKPYTLPRNYADKLTAQLEKYQAELRDFGLTDEEDNIILSKVVRVLVDRGLPYFLKDLEALHESRMARVTNKKPPQPVETVSRNPKAKEGRAPKELRTSMELQYHQPTNYRCPRCNTNMLADDIGGLRLKCPKCGWEGF